MRLVINKRVVYTIISLVAIITTSFFAIQYAKGKYRVTSQGFIEGAGLLAANSFPTAAEVLVNGKLIGVTDNTFYLEPEEYEVEIVKDGYAPWKKRITIEPELVVQTNATLFPKAPSLNTLSFTGAQNLSPSPDGQKVIYYADANSSTKKNGLYLLELSNNAFSFQKEPVQISDDPSSIDLATAHFIWSPDSSEVMMITAEKEVLLNLGVVNGLETLSDISFSRKQILSEWEQEMYIREQENLSKFPEEIIAIATQSAKNVYISPDKKRLLYTATESVQLPEQLVPPLLATSTQLEQRILSAGSVYVYDREEDKNFLVGSEQKQLETNQNNEKHLLTENKPSFDAVTTATTSATDLISAANFNSLQASDSAQTAANFRTYHSSVFTNTLQWFPNSKHLIYIEDATIKIMEYDAANQTTIYSGPFAENFVYPWPNGDRLIILTSFSPDAPFNIYSLELKK